jgi:hypothetical protein
MTHFRKAEFHRTATITLIVLACISLAFGSNVNALLASRLAVEAHVADSGYFPQQTFVPEEAPQESSGPEEQTEEIEAASFSFRRKAQKALRTHVHVVQTDGVDVCKSCLAQAVFISNRAFVRQFEYCFRNGCGAHLRR